MNKLFASPEAAIHDVFEGATIAIGGFFVAGVPLTLINALAKLGVKGLTLAAGTGPLLGFAGTLDALVRNGQINKVIDSYPFYRSPSRGARSIFEQGVRAGEIDIEVYPMGTLAEKYRCAAAGLPAFYTPTGIGTYVAEGKETRFFNGIEAILETALKPDFAFVHAYMADTEGNVTYRKTARNFNAVMAAAAAVTIVEAENVVQPGEMDPDKVHTPGIYVQRVVQVERPKVRISID